MGQIEQSAVIEGIGSKPLSFAGTPSVGTTEIQTITVGGTPTSGTFTLTLEGYTTAAITWSATNTTLFANVDAALEALANVGASGCVVAVGTMTAGIGTMTVTFSGGNRARQPLGGVMTADAALLVGTAPTVTVARTTPGVAATFRGAGVGALVNDVTNGKLYINSGTALTPIWTVVGAQS